jgi:hypothetical protein
MTIHPISFSATTQRALRLVAGNRRAGDGFCRNRTTFPGGGEITDFINDYVAGRLTGEVRESVPGEEIPISDLPALTVGSASTPSRCVSFGEAPDGSRR